MKKLLLITAIVIAISLTACQSEEAPSEVLIEESASRSAETTLPTTEESSVEAFETVHDFKEVEIPDFQVLGPADSNVMWGNDPSDIKNLVESNTVVVKAKVLSKNEVLFLYNEKHYLPSPYTPVNIEINEILYGNGKELPSKITTHMEGGNVLLRKVFEFNEIYFPPKNEGKFGEKGLKDLSEEELNTTRMPMTMGIHYNLLIDGEYILVLEHLADFDEYIVTNGGYGVFEKSEPDKRIALRTQAKIIGRGEDVPDSISSVNARSFAEYGNVLTGFDLDLSVLP